MKNLENLVGGPLRGGNLIEVFVNSSCRHDLNDRSGAEKEDLLGHCGIADHQRPIGCWQ